MPAEFLVIFILKIAYAGMYRRSRVYTRIRMIQVTYAFLRPKRIIHGGITMVLAHKFERHVDYLISSKNTICNYEVFIHGIGKG